MGTIVSQETGPYEALMATSSTHIRTLAAWDAVETRDRIRKSQVSAQEVVEAAIAHAEEVRHLGAVVERMYERARANAGARGGEVLLAGVPTFVKDLAQIRGEPTTWGSRASGRYVSRKTDPFVMRFEETGVVTLGKSACPELGLTAATEPLECSMRSGAAAGYGKLASQSVDLADDRCHFQPPRSGRRLADQRVRPQTT
jgi:hypothetical protein